MVLQLLQRKKAGRWQEHPVFFGCMCALFLGISVYMTWRGVESVSVIFLDTITLVMAGIAFWTRPVWVQLLISFLIVTAHLVAKMTIVPGIHWMLMDYVIGSLLMMISSSQMKNYVHTKQNSLDLIVALTKTLDSRDSYTAFHSQNVAHYAMKIAEEMKLPKKMREHIYIAGLIHDLGKIGVPEHILSKPSRLTDGEFSIMKQHTVIGYETLKHIVHFKDTGILDSVLYHHEKYNGGGYPYGLAGEEIPLPARILAIADSFDAMTSKRIYRQHDHSFEEAVLEIERCRGTQFDPSIADLFLNILRREGEQLVKSRESLLPQH